MSEPHNESATRFMSWVAEQFILYGDKNINDWWKEEGLNSFLSWADKKGIKYVNMNEVR